MDHYVTDKLHSLLGLVNNTLVDYVIAVSQSADSADSLYTRLTHVGLPEDQRTRDFSAELYKRTSSNRLENEKKKRSEEAEARKLLKRNSSYKLVHEPEEDEDVEKLTRKKQSKKIRSEKKEDNWNPDPEDGLAVLHRKRQEQLSEQELERIQDQKEKEEFEQRLREKDSLNTKMKTAKKLDPETAKRRSLANDKQARQSALPELRERARQEYLRKRNEERLLLLEKRIQDEEILFSNQQLTERERKQLEYDKQVLQLARERMQVKEVQDGYMMPDDYITEKGKIDKKKQEALLYKRYQDTLTTKATKEAQPSEQEQWELQQIKKMVNPDQPIDEQEALYDYVFDEEQHIDFVLDKSLHEPMPKSDDTPALSESEKKKMTIQQVRESLPVYKYRDDILSAIEEFQVLIIVGETGSGKTTQLPQYLFEAGYTKGNKKIGCTQPRRVAAMSVATRVAEEMGVKLGQQVGYSIRFEDFTSDKTVVKYMTDGMLLREFLTEPDLSSYSCLIIDEAHERTLHTDILFGLVKDIVRFRPDLKLIISSATMDAQKFSEYFDNAPIFNVPGRRYPVEVYHTAAPEANYLAAAITTIMTIHITQDAGDILLFLTGQEEIEACQESLTQITKSLGNKIRELVICPIYSTLPTELQSKIFEPTPPDARKVVLATNIAETSITIDGIVYVIDTGFTKQKGYNPKTGMESLLVVPCSRASANQRKGRAGRLSPGKCFRLYTKWAYENELEANPIPEIQRTNLANVVLLLKSLGINDLLNFDFMDAPPAETLIRSLEMLYALGALNDRGELTKTGRRMAEFPIDPMMAKCIIEAEKYGCTEEVVTICSMLSVQNAIFYRPKDKAVLADNARRMFWREGGDHLSLLAIYNTWAENDFSKSWCYENYIQHRSMHRSRDVREQLLSLMERAEVPLISNPDPKNTILIRKALLSGFFYNVAKLGKGGDVYRGLKSGGTVLIHPSSSLFPRLPKRDPNSNSVNAFEKEEEPEIKLPKWVLYFELVFTTREYMRQVCEISPEWLLEVAPHYYKEKDVGGDLVKVSKRVGKSTNAR